MKIKNIEHAWIEMKNILPSYIKIGKIENYGLKVFDITIPRAHANKSNNIDITCTWDSGLVLFVELTNESYDVTNISDIVQVINSFLKKASINEAKNIISIEDNNEMKGFDKLIIVKNPDNWDAQEIYEKLDYLRKHYFLEVYPTRKFGVYISKYHLKEFTNFINNKLFNMNEAAIVSTGLIQQIDKGFVTTLSDEGLRNAILQIKSSMDEYNTSDIENASHYHREAEDKWEIIADEFRKRGLPLNESWVSDKSKLLSQGKVIINALNGFLRILDDVDEEFLSVVTPKNNPFPGSIDEEIITMITRFDELLKIIKK